MPCSNQARVPAEPYFALHTKDDLLNAAFQTAPAVFRLLHLSVPRWWVRSRYPVPSSSLAALDRGASLWPFTFNRFSSAMRTGFLVVRDGRPVDVLLTALS